MMTEHLALYEIDRLTDRFGLRNGVPKGVKPHYNIVPAMKMPVVTSRSGANVLSMMGWGLVTEGAKDTNSIFRYKTYNVMAEKVFSKQTWDTAVHERRCIVPVNGFYLIRKDDPTSAYYFFAGEKAVIGLAGIYTGGSDPTDEAKRTFTILTTESNDSMPLPFGRIPLILTRENEDAWTDPAVTELSPIIRAMEPYSDTVLRYRKVSPDIRSKKIDAKYLIEPVIAT